MIKKSSPKSSQTRFVYLQMAARSFCNHNETTMYAVQKSNTIIRLTRCSHVTYSKSNVGDSQALRGKKVARDFIMPQIQAKLNARHFSHPPPFFYTNGTTLKYYVKQLPRYRSFLFFLIIVGVFCTSCCIIGNKLVHLQQNDTLLYYNTSKSSTAHDPLFSIAIDNGNRMVTAVVLNWKRLSNLQAVVLHLSQFSIFKVFWCLIVMTVQEIVIWNNNPEMELTHAVFSHL